MADFLGLTPDDRREALETAAAASGRPAHLLEKDVWVVWALATLFGSEEGEHLVFKGGTSLSKVYHAIRRFSEDVDLTYDIRALASDLVGDAEDALPKTPSEQKRWTKAIRTRLPEWVGTKALPLIENALAAQGLDAVERSDGDKIFIEYEPLMRGAGYVRPRVMLEFGARSTGEPADLHDVACDAAEHLDMLTFPKARPRVMRAERTFWEKATAIHVFCAQGSFRGGANRRRRASDPPLAGQSSARVSQEPLLRACSSIAACSASDHSFTPWVLSGIRWAEK